MGVHASHNIVFGLRQLFVLCVILSLYLVPCAAKTLILVENYGVKETHSIFLSYLTTTAGEVTYKMADDSTLSVFQFGELMYENIIIMAPSTHDFGGDVNAGKLSEFVDKGGNLMVFADESIGDAVRDFGYECGVEFEESQTNVIDHLNFDTSDQGLHTRLFIDPTQVIQNKLIVGEVTKPLLFEGVAMVTDEENELLINVVSASSTAYSFFPSDKITDHPDAVGKSAGLVTSLQGRNNARVSFIGSMAMFSDKFILSPAQKFAATKVFDTNGNGDFMRAITQWTLKRVGVLRISDVKHHLKGESTAPAYYTVTEDVVYSIKIEEFANGKWVEFKNKDVQMEFVRIDPFVRLTMGKENASYVAKFKLPDVYGVFQFKVNYRRQGYTFLSSATQVSVRPLEHTQYERFIPVAYPYYTSAFSMMIGVLLFSFVFLHFKDNSVKQKAN